MNVEIVISLYVLLFQQQFILKTQASDICYYLQPNNTRATIICDDECCSSLGYSPQTACCSSISWSSLAIPFFIVAGVCIFAICLIYCRPLWKTCLCGHKCPFGNRTRVSSPNSMLANDNPVYVMNNDDLPDYETITKDSPMKDITPPPYNFVAAHPHDFGIEGRIPSAPPQYHSRRSSLATTNPITPVE